MRDGMKTRIEIGLVLEWFVGWKLKEELTLSGDGNGNGCSWNCK